MTIAPLAETEAPLRILIVCELWQGSNSYAFARTFRRQGHSVAIVAEDLYSGSGWRSKGLRILRRLLMPLIRREFNHKLFVEAAHLQPHLLFICKGRLLQAETLDRINALGTTTMLWWPDISFFAEGAEVPRALPLYDWIFTTKTFGPGDLQQRLGLTNASFMPHAFDPETHRRFPTDASDHARMACDVSFIGTWSPKKEALIERLVDARPDIDLKIWGAQWEKAGLKLRKFLKFQEIFGSEYAKAIRLTKINLGLLREVRPGGSSGDLITSRTFHIPASGGFMLHERTSEIVDYFAEDRECALFADADEMIAKIDYFLAHDAERMAIAEAGYHHSRTASYSLDDRVGTVLEKYRALQTTGAL